MTRPAVTAIALDADAREEFEERAAIREYLGGMSRVEAERHAVEDVRDSAEARQRGASK